MTPRQAEYYRAIKFYISEFGYSPGLREIREMIGISSLAAAKKAVDQLDTRGFIRRKFDINGNALYRSMELTELR